MIAGFCSFKMAAAPKAHIKRISNNQNIGDLHEQVIQAVKRGDNEKLKSILKPIRKTPKCLQVLSKESRNGLRALHYTLSEMSCERKRSRLDIVATIIECVCKDQRLQLFKLKSSSSGQCTALHAAAANKELDVVKALLESLSSKDQQKLIEMKDGRNRSVLNYELTSEICQLIQSFSEIEEKADVNTDDSELLDDEDDWTLLSPMDQFAPTEADEENSQENPENRKYMVPWRWPVDGDDISFQSADPVTYVTVENMFEHFDYITELIEANNSFGILTNELKNEDGRTFLHLLAMNKKVELVSKLLGAISTDHWSLISYPCKQGKTALHYASFADSVEIIRLLLHYCPKEKRWELLSKPCGSKKTCLYYASKVASIDGVKTLLTYSGENDRKFVEDIVDDFYRAGQCTGTEEITWLLKIVETHYWRVFYNKPRTLIFYNAFKDCEPHWKRDGAEEEKNDMVEAFQRWGIEPKVFADFTEDTLRSEIMQTVQKEHEELSALIVVIMSHGKENIVYDAYAREIQVQNIINIMCFNSWLEGIPKVSTEL